MTIDTVVGLQVTTIVMLILSLFGGYHVIVKGIVEGKDSAIGALKGQVDLLKDQLAQANARSAESLLLRLDDVTKAAVAQLARAEADKMTDKAELMRLQAKVDELQHAQQLLQGQSIGDVLRAYGVVGGGSLTFTSAGSSPQTLTGVPPTPPKQP